MKLSTPILMMLLLMYITITNAIDNLPDNKLVGLQLKAKNKHNNISNDIKPRKEKINQNIFKECIISNKSIYFTYTRWID